ncbi:hypothetical protein F5144DRAFT_617645 [Chaetomium tenue]|uniref:Uncharacterized protein n=1 Tax=Chaetomium tenue TaxID=1854479 RepID=A0ACB7PTJ3_9PEZI|nr:hypothetical protein F5144DRAFT_617645 [Chaetomium globosum]
MTTNHGPFNEEAQSSNHLTEPRTSGRGQTPGTRRPSTIFTRAEYNVQHFRHNLNHDDTAVRFANRATTRRSARLEAERQQQLQRELQREDEQESEQEQLQLQPQQTTPEVTDVQSTLNPHQNGSVEKWKPSIVIGSPLWAEGEDLNTIQIADRKVIQTRLWVDHYRGVPYFVEKHQKAVEERAQLDESAEENTLPRSALKSTHSDAIHDRLDVLRSLLQDTTFPGEQTNLQAAIAGYESGAIPYSDSYTLLWAGHIVDRCPDFDSFTHDRAARLDRYEAAHGPGWLWYEPPLSGSSTNATMRGPTIVAKKGFCLESKHAWRQGTENMGHYNIRMGFRRRKNTVTRSPTTRSPTPTTPNPTKNKRTRTPSIPQPDTSPAGTTVPDTDGPQLIYNMLLDSGATLPTLWAGDLPALGIDPGRYSAQSARRVNTADSVLVSRVYELDVRVLGGEEAAPVGLFEGQREGEGVAGGVGGVAAASAAVVGVGNGNGGGGEGGQSEDGGEFGVFSCTIPVLVFPGNSKDFGAADQVPDRLSGLLPFHVCYLSGAPGTFKLWMGEERRDVLGAGRLPGMMRYGEILGAAQTGEKLKRVPASTTLKLVQWRNQSLRAPDRVIFEHDPVDDAGGVLRDEDVGDGNVIMHGPRGTDFEKLDPQADGVQVLHIGRKRKRAYLEPRGRGSTTTRSAKKKRSYPAQTQASARDYPSLAMCCTVPQIEGDPIAASNCDWVIK